MLKHSNTYNNNLISRWFITLMLFFSIGGYTNYTQPISSQDTIELVITNEESFAKISSFKDILADGQHFNSFYLFKNHLKLISKHHSNISIVKNKDLDTSISLTMIDKIFLFRNNVFTSEEDSFHLG
ncbi:hypothetical protein [uncultured Aquimarina sp.]|uniref:hypothetical protein n=1 Tax=uncultured Aquimarina sp. TaxID=575652 RepID=UPI002604B0DB|nr:hypothetical protein [uncultured Aquimarina sp.]